ncbi:unnamed protein product [Pylaiella littoralis]
MFVRLRQSSAVVRSSVREAFLSSHRSSAPIPDFLATSTLPPRRCFSGSREGQVGFIGLGNMGSCMAKSLVKAGHDVVLFDVDSSKAQTLAAETGARAVSSAKEMAQGSSSIITMLPNTSNVEAVYLGDPELSREGNEIDSSPSAAAKMVKRRNNTEMGFGLLDWVRSGTLLVDSSTIDPLASRRVNAIAKSKGITMVDAPVSGGVPAAADATLTFIVGGTSEGMERARPLLLSMGSKTIHCGEAGTGCIAKVCNNLSLAISMAGVAEAMSLGSKMGMDPKVLASVLNSSTARCWSSEAYNPCPGVMENVPSSKGFQGGFTASLMEKDLHLALQAARESCQSLPMGAHAHQLYSLLCNQGSAHKDFSSIFEFISRENPPPPPPQQIERRRNSVSKTQISYKPPPRLEHEQSKEATGGCSFPFPVCYRCSKCFGADPSNENGCLS